MTDHHDQQRQQFIRRESWWTDKLTEAQKRHGKPFKCGPVCCKREVLHKGEIIVRKAS